MKKLLLKSRDIGALSFVMISIVFEQTIEKKVYQTVFTKTPPVIDGIINDSCRAQLSFLSGLKAEFTMIPVVPLHMEMI
jgi:hypothetical protein